MEIKPRQLTLSEHLDGIAKTAAQTAAAAPETAGACLRTDPQTGQPVCIFTDPATCKNIGGVFLGGPCGN
jgi:hypothetical protein